MLLYEDKCEHGVLRACAIRLRELSLLSPEEDDGVLEGLDEFFAEEQVAVQKKKKSKKLKDGKAAKIKRRKKEVMLHALTPAWGGSSWPWRRGRLLRVQLAAGKHLSGVAGWKGGALPGCSCAKQCSPGPGR